MRAALVLGVFLAGCGEVSPAGGVQLGEDGGAGTGGAQAAAGTTGGAGTTGSAGTSGTGGAALPTSCAIPIASLNATFTGGEITWDKCGALQTVAGVPTVTVTNGMAGTFFGSWPSLPISYTSVAHSEAHPSVGDPTTDGKCIVKLTYTRPGSCTAPEMDTMFLETTVPAI